MWISKKETAVIRQNLKTGFPNTKFSVRGAGYALTITIIKSDIDFSSFFTVGLDEEHYIRNTYGTYYSEEQIADEIKHIENKDSIKYFGYSHLEENYRSNKAVEALGKIIYIIEAKNDQVDIGYSCILYINNPNK